MEHPAAQPCPSRPSASPLTPALQASAAQRSGRAGRTGPGHAYRLYSSAVFGNQFSEYSAPEILQRPIEGTVLQMKSMGIHDVPSFPFPTPPDPEGLKTAVRTLSVLGALDTEKERITALGRTLAAFPLAPRYSRCLLLAHQGGCLAYVVAIVSSLTVENLFAPDPRASAKQEQKEEEARRERLQQLQGKDGSEAGALVGRQAQAAAAEKKQRESEAHSRVSKALEAARWRWRHADSDLLSSLRVVGGYDHAADQEQFCKRCGRDPALRGRLAVGWQGRRAASLQLGR